MVPFEKVKVCMRWKGLQMEYFANVNNICPATLISSN